MWFIMISDWPMIIGGKPNFSYGQNLPAFIPVTFEATVFCAAHLMVITFYLDVVYSLVHLQEIQILELLMINF